MSENTKIEWCESSLYRPAASGPQPRSPRDEDRVQARQRINVLVRTAKIAHPNTLPCVDCSHIWAPTERRHEYDHYHGYAKEHHYCVVSVCTICHAKRDSARKAQTHCKHGHEFTKENTYIARNGSRHCKQCSQIREKSRKPRGKEFWKKINANRKHKNYNLLDGRTHDGFPEVKL